MVFAGITACQLVVDVELPKFEPSMVINSVINADSTINVKVSRNRHILDPYYTSSFVSNARLSLYSNGHIVGYLSESMSQTGTYVSNFIPEPGVAYTLVAEHDSLPTAQATTMVPKKFIVPTVSVVDVRQPNGSAMDYQSKMRLRFQDAAGPDYYQVAIYYWARWQVGFDEEGNPIWEERFYQTYFEPINPESDFEEYSPGDFFSDELFDGKNHRIDFNVYSYAYDHENNEPDTSTFLMDVRMISEEYYKYLASLQAQDNSSGNIFAEPAPVFNNIENGFGIFGAFRSNTIEFKLYKGQLVE